MPSNPSLDIDDGGQLNRWSVARKHWEENKSTRVVRTSELQASFHNMAAHSDGKALAAEMPLLPDRCVRCALYLQAYEAICGCISDNLNYCRKGRLFAMIYDRGITCTTLDLFTAPGTTALKNIGIRRMPSGYTGSQLALAFVQKQIHSCVRSHSLCGGEQDRPLPTRLIDLRHPAVVRLRETGNASGRYAALSYCWGQDENLRTTSATYHAHTNGISRTRLPKTFVDAIDFCHRIAIDFIWIDSLCIIQDSLEDWNIEPAKMGDVYSNAFFTIAASASETTSGGCYYHQEFQSHHIATVDIEGTSTELFARRPWHHLDCEILPLGVNISSDEVLSPLQKRAWVFQERLMAARVIHFTRNEIMWECREHSTCECMDQIPLDCLPSELAAFKKRDTVSEIYRSMKRGQTSSVYEMMEGWKRLAREYSKLALTKPTDRLPALSGVVAQVDKGLLGNYLAGLWKNCLPYWLCWYVESHTSVNPPIQYPSWSWCGVQGPVLHDLKWLHVSGNGEKVLIETSWFESKIHIISADCKPVGLNPYGHVSAGTIILHGNVFRATSLYVTYGEGSTDDLLELYFDGKTRSPYLDHNRERTRELGFMNPAYCLQVYDHNWLILQCVDEERQIYRRRGYTKSGRLETREEIASRISSEPQLRGPLLDEDVSLRTITLI